MYDIAKKARSGMKAKAERLAGEKDRKTDSSDWTPPAPLNADVKTGMRPVSRRAYKDGGKVHGDAAKKRADRAPRKAGGKVEEKGEQPLVDRYINRDLKKANDYRDGEKHVGALKHGGRAKKADGGSMTMEEMIKKNPAPKKDEGFKAPNPVPLPPRRKPEPVPPRDYENADPRLIKACSGGRMKRADGGPVGDPRLNMVKPKAMEFGQNVVTPGLKSGGRAKSAKGKTNINIIIAAGKTDKPSETPMAPMGAGAPPAIPPAAMLGAGAPPPAGGPAMPPMGAPPMPAGGMKPPMGPPPMPRKDGGRISKVAKSYKDMEAGSGSGEGRLQKTDIAKRAPHKAGGKVYRSYKDMDAGAGSGEGRLEKTEIQSRKK